MEKADDIFLKQWEELVRMYKEDWKDNLKTHGKDALKYLPEHFYSEGDVEAIFSCMLRDKLLNETHNNSEYVIRNQLRFGPDSYKGFTIHDKIIKMKKLIERIKLEKESFVPDIVVDTIEREGKDHFLLFAELTYQPGYTERYNEGIPQRIYDLIEKTKEEAKTMTAAIDAGVCKSGYVGVISDDLVSIDGAMKLMEELKNSYPKVKFLSDGMTLEEKNEILSQILRNSKSRKCIGKIFSMMSRLTFPPFAVSPSNSKIWYTNSSTESILLRSSWLPLYLLLYSSNLIHDPLPPFNNFYR